MPRATRAQVKRRMLYLRGQGIDININTNANGYRAENVNGDRNISPRLSLREMIDWLEAFETGYEMGKEMAVSDMRKGRLE